MRDGRSCISRRGARHHRAGRRNVSTLRREHVTSECTRRSDRPASTQASAVPGPPGRGRLTVQTAVGPAKPPLGSMRPAQASIAAGGQLALAGRQWNWEPVGASASCGPPPLRRGSRWLERLCEGHLSDDHRRIHDPCILDLRAADLDVRGALAHLATPNSAGPPARRTRTVPWPQASGAVANSTSSPRRRTGTTRSRPAITRCACWGLGTDPPTAQTDRRAGRPSGGRHRSAGSESSPSIRYFAWSG